MTTLTVNIKDISQIAIIKKILKAFNVELIERLEKHQENFQNPAYREQNYTTVDPKNW